MTDLISREDAKKAFCRINDLRTLSLGKVGEVLDALPSADTVHIETYRELYEKYVELKHASAEAVHGEWLYVENEPYSECSKCGRYIDDLDEDKYAYCPYCGVRMEAHE